MRPAERTMPLTFDEKYILRALLYFDIFKHPLLPDEIYRFSPGSVTRNIHEILFHLNKRGLIHHIHPFYSLRKERSIIEQRLKSNARARKKLRLARVIAACIAQLPFVRSIAISGSLSKGVAGSRSDIDYFIITHPGRVWVVRAMLAVFKRVFLLNSHRYLCANYYVDTRHLEIEDKNIYTAMEVATLIPMYGHASFKRFIDANDWVHRWLPNALKTGVKPQRDRISVFKRLFEHLLRNRSVDWLDSAILHLAINRLRKKYQAQYPVAVYEVAFRSRPGVSKNHPMNYQGRVLNALEEKISQFEHEFDLSVLS